MFIYIKIEKNNSYNLYTFLFIKLAFQCGKMNNSNPTYSLYPISNSSYGHHNSIYGHHNPNPTYICIPLFTLNNGVYEPNGYN